MPAMTKTQLHDFLMRPNIAKIATIGDDGSPYLVPVWYHWDGHFLYMAGRKRSEWVGHIAKRPRVAVLVDETVPPLRRVLFVGTAELVEPGPEWKEYSAAVSKKYMGEGGEKYASDSSDQPRRFVKVTPSKTITWIEGEGREQWHHRYYEPGSKWHREYHGLEAP